MSQWWLAEALIDLVLPAHCLGCRRHLGRPEDLGLCVLCRGRLRVLRGVRCAGCGLAPPTAAPPDGYLCGACRLSPPPYDRLLSVWSYEPPLDQVIQEMKFARLHYLGPEIGRAMADRFLPEVRECDAVVPVPLHWRRRWTRGYNQSELMAVALARHAGLPCIPALRRARATPPQTRRSRTDRIRAMDGAFRARRGTPVAGRAILLVDDVFTTGSTLRSAAGTLRRAGACSILAVTAARTPEIPRQRPPRQTGNSRLSD